MKRLFNSLMIAAAMLLSVLSFAQEPQRPDLMALKPSTATGDETAKILEQTDPYGTPVRRVIYGYSIVQTEKGKQATRVSWAEDYQGGSYGAVHSYGVGGGQFYIQ